MPTKYAYELGRRWNVKTPRRDIGYVVDAMHVGQSDSEVTAAVESRIPAGHPGYTPLIRRQCVEYALLRHAANRKLYRSVMLGV